MSVEKKMPFEMNDEERDLFSIAVKTDDHSGTEVEVVDAVWSGDLDLWVWRNDESVALIMGNVVEYRDGFREYFVSMLSGNNVMDIQSSVTEDFGKEISKLGCQNMSAFIKIDMAKKFGSFTEGSYLHDKTCYVVIRKEV